MITEAKVEQNIREALADEPDIQGARIVGAWDTAASGDVRGIEGVSDDRIIAVAVGMRQMAEYGAGCAIPVDLACSIAISQRAETAPDAVSFMEMLEAATNVVFDWVKNEDAESTSDLEVEDEFSVGGVQFTGGEAPSYDSTAGVWTASLTFTVRGIIK